MNILFHSKQLYRSCILIITICCFSSCAFLLFPKVIKVPSIQNLSPVGLDSTGKIEINSLSTLDRWRNTSLRFEKAQITNRYDNRTFDRMTQLLKYTILNKKPIFFYHGSNRNDSIYLGLINPYFCENFSEKQMQSIIFSKETQDGNYLVVTHLLIFFIGLPSAISEHNRGAGVDTRTYYEFMKVKNGNIEGYSGYCLYKNASFRRKNPFPIKKDLKKIGKRLIKDAKRK